MRPQSDRVVGEMLTHIPSSASSLPTEVWDLIFGYLKDDGRSLSACRLTSRTWSILLERHMFHTMAFNPRIPPPLPLMSLPPRTRQWTRHLRIRGNTPNAWWGCGRMDETSIDHSLLRSIMASLPGLLSLSLDLVHLKFEVEDHPERFEIKELRLRHVTASHCCGFLDFLCSFSRIGLLSCSRAPSYDFLHVQDEQDSAVCPARLDMPEISAFKIDDLAFFSRIWHRRQLVATLYSSHALTSLDLTCTSPAAFLMCTQPDTSPARLQSFSFDMSPIKNMYGQLLGTSFAIMAK